jgi:hypothetical protein
MNAAQFCGATSNTPIGNDNVNCPNRNATNVVLEYSKTSIDQSLSRVITISYINDNGIIREL